MRKSVLEVVVPDLGVLLAAFRFCRVSPGGSGGLGLGLGFYPHPFDGEGGARPHGAPVSPRWVLSRCRRRCGLCQAEGDKEAVSAAGSSGPTLCGDPQGHGPTLVSVRSLGLPATGTQDGSGQNISSQPWGEGQGGGG